MTRRDALVVFLLGAVLVALVGAIGYPALLPAATPAPSPTAAADLVFREGIVGQPGSVSPVGARTQADRDIVALAFRGLVRLGPGEELLPDLAERWTVTDKGRTWTFVLRSDARWQDGHPVTAADVVFTARVLRDPAIVGPQGGTWRQVTATALDDRTVRLELETPLGGFLHAALQPLLPAHLLRDIPVEALADDPFWRSPIGSGSFRLVTWDEQVALLEPVLGSSETGSGWLASLGPREPGTAPMPLLPRVELHFYPDSAALAAAYRAGEVDAASGLAAGEAMGLLDVVGTRIIRYPGVTLTSVTLNLRPANPALADERVRRALLGAIDRDALVRQVVAGLGTRADSPVPPSSWAFDAAAAAPVAYSRPAATAALRKASWKKLAGGWAAPGATKPYVLDLITPEATSNPVARATATQVVQAWTALGFDARVSELPAAEFVDRLQAGQFTAALVDVSIGLDPDLYPLLASTQARADGSNVSGIQDPALDAALSAARGAVAMETRKQAYARLEQLLAISQPILPLFFRDILYVASDRLAGPASRPIADPSGRYWDVLTWRAAGR